MVIKVSGLDLTTAAGREMLQQRVDRAIGAVCGSPDVRSTSAMHEFNVCATQARAATHTQVEAAIAAAMSEKNVASSSHTPTVRTFALRREKF